MKSMKITEEIRCMSDYDIIVCGAGVAGIAAAVAAKRKGKSVLLLEKSTILGGLATLGLINYFVPMDNGDGVCIIKGMCAEFVELSRKYGWDYTTEEWRDGKEPGPGCRERYIVEYSPNIMALTFNEYLAEEGVQVYYDCQVTNVVMEGKHCKGVVVQTKAGKEFYGAKIIIDTTGDADVMYQAGVPTVIGGNYHTYITKKATLKTCEKAIETRNISKMMTSQHGGTIDLFGRGQPKEKSLYTCTSLDDISEYLVSNQQECLDKIKDFDRFSRDIITMPGMCQFRTTRHIIGEYSLQVEDKYRHFEDSVSAIVDFMYKYLLYEIPYRTMYHREFDNLICAGRCIDATGYAWDIVRVIPPAIVTGQAAGVAAALAVENETSIQNVDIKQLQKELSNQNVIIHFDDKLVPKDTEIKEQISEEGF